MISHDFLTIAYIDDFIFSNWYRKFNQISQASIVIPLNQDFIDYLLSDSIILPLNPNGQIDDLYKTTDFFSDSESETSIENQSETPHFPLLFSAVLDGITKLGGYVFPKLNWSSPKDSSWISLNNSLKCQTVIDIIILLKSSDFIMFDLTHAYDLCLDNELTKTTNPNHNSHPKYELVLRQWVDMNPSMEFRCFIKNKKLIGISQRDCTHFYPFLINEHTTLSMRIQDFYQSNIMPIFNQDHYVFDVYLTKTKVWIVDMNPFTENTDSLLYSWDELYKDSSSVFEMRFIHNDEDAMFFSKGNSLNRVPIELLDLSPTGFNEIIESMKSLDHQ